MNCPECQELLQRRLDGEDTADRVDVQAHLASCAECRERHAAAALLLEGLRALPRPAVPPGLEDRTCAALLRDRHNRRRFWFRAGAGLALAASLLITAFGLGWLDFLFAPPGQAPVAVSPPKDPPAPRPEPVLTQSLAEVKVALAKVAEGVADTAEQPAKVLLVAATPLELVSLDNLPGVGPMTNPLEATGRSLQRTSQGAAAASRAVSGLTRRALGHFLGQAAPARPQADTE